MNKRITVWLDDTSQEHGWIVSEDDELGSTTLEVCDDREQAITVGQRIAAERGLPLVESAER